MGMTFKVVDAEEPQSIQEQEAQIQQDFEASQSEDVTTDEQEVDDVIVEQDIDDARVLNYLKDRYQKEYTSLDEVLTQNEKQAELPEDIKKLMEYGVDNYIKINKDWDNADSTETLKEYYKQTKPHLDDADIEYLLEEEYSFDEDIDDDRDIKRKQVALKEELFRAKSYLNNLKEQYKVDLGSKAADVTEDYKKAFNFYQEYEAQSKQAEQINQAKAKVFDDKTSQLFSDEFKGFEFNLGDKKQVYKPKDVNETKTIQSNISDVIKQHLDENGVLKDAHSYHKALAMFRDPDGFAKFFYEQGKADSTNNVIKGMKNIDMNVRDSKEVTDNSDGPRMRAISDESFESGLRIRKR
jgi:hypothetical protein